METMDTMEKIKQWTYWGKNEDVAGGKGVGKKGLYKY